MSKKVEEEFLTLSKKDVELAYKWLIRLRERKRFGLNWGFISEIYPECNQQVFTREDRSRLDHLQNNCYNMIKQRIERLNPYVFVTKINSRTGKKTYQIVTDIVSIRKIRFPGERKEKKHLCIRNDKDTFTAYKIPSIDV